MERFARPRFCWHRGKGKVSSWLLREGGGDVLDCSPPGWPLGNLLEEVWRTAPVPSSPPALFDTFPWSHALQHFRSCLSKSADLSPSSTDPKTYPINSAPSWAARPPLCLSPPQLCLFLLLRARSPGAVRAAEGLKEFRGEGGGWRQGISDAHYSLPASPKIILISRCHAGLRCLSRQHPGGRRGGSARLPRAARLRFGSSAAGSLLATPAGPGSGHPPAVHPGTRGCFSSRWIIFHPAACAKTP